MKRKRYLIAVALLAIALILGALFSIRDLSNAGSAGKAEDYIAELARKVAEAEKTEQRVLVGKDGWLFFMGELRSISVGPFWGEAAAKVSRASRPKYADPLPAIVEFSKQCEKAGAELILIPVPAKSMIYADKISDAVKPGSNGKLPRLDVHHQEFYKKLKANGVQVLDLTDTFLERRFDKAGNMYCKHDTHWSSRACHLTAKLIADKARKKPWFKAVKKKQFLSQEKKLEISGDLWRYLKDRKAEAEHLPMVFTGTREAGQPGLMPVKRDRDSPVVLIGDSHTLVFNAGEDLHTRGAGLADHLALELGFAIDHIGVRGSGSTVPRIDLARRKDNLKGKKLVIWCFACRQFTESMNGWMTKVPVVR
jgi:alginate O-acetyltransferase complex protein AlgJ